MKGKLILKSVPVARVPELILESVPVARSVRAALCAVLLLAGCVSPSPEVIASAQRGHDDARSDIARHRPRVAFIGLVRDDESALDPSTGLTRFSAGCCKSHERIAYCDAYNDEIDAARGRGALAGMTLQRKATTRAAVEARFDAGGATQIRLGGPATTSPGARFRVEIAPGAGRVAVALWSTDAVSGERSELRYLGADEARIAFDGDGSTLFLRDDGARLYATFDLPTALPLQVFPDPPRER